MISVFQFMKKTSDFHDFLTILFEHYIVDYVISDVNPVVWMLTVLYRGDLFESLGIIV